VLLSKIVALRESQNRLVFKSIFSELKTRKVMVEIKGAKNVPTPFVLQKPKTGF
jgi:hypothetical protein